jgi:general secretion pathway protein N
MATRPWLPPLSVPRFLNTPHRKTPARRSAPWAWALGGVLLGLLAGALVFAPARWLATALVWSDSPLQLHNAEGTVWSGSGQPAFRSDRQGGTALPGRLAWTLRPAWLPGGPALRTEWRMDCCLSQPWAWRIQTDLHSVQVRPDDLDSTDALRIPAAVLSGLGAPWNTLQPQGQMELSTRGLDLRIGQQGLQLQGALQLDAQSVATSLSTLRPVGSYRLTIEGGARPALTLSTLTGALQLRGTGTFYNQGLVFDGEATAQEGREDALSNLLNIIGQRQGARSLIHLG